MFTSPANIVLSLKRMSDDRAVYRRQNKLAFNYETRSNFTVNLAVANTWRQAAPTMPLVTTAGDAVGHLTEKNVEHTLR